MLHDLVAVPFSLCTKQVMNAAIEVWCWVINKAPDLESALIWQVQAEWAKTIQHRRGFFSTQIKYVWPKLPFILQILNSRPAFFAAKRTLFQTIPNTHLRTSQR